MMAEKKRRNLINTNLNINWKFNDELLLILCTSPTVNCVRSLLGRSGNEFHQLFLLFASRSEAFTYKGVVKAGAVEAMRTNIAG